MKDAKIEICQNKEVSFSYKQIARILMPWVSRVSFIKDIQHTNSKLSDSKKKTYELLKIKHPQIEVLKELFSNDNYYRVILLKDEGHARVLACSKTNISKLPKRVKRDILNRKIPIGFALNKNSVAGERTIYSIFKVILKKKINSTPRSSRVKLGRAYFITSRKGEIVFNIIEVFL